MTSLADVVADLGEQAVEFIERSDWPVDTGYSLRHFGHRSAGTAAQITNAADYAPHVEARTGVVARTLNNARFDETVYGRWLETELDRGT